MIKISILTTHRSKIKSSISCPKWLTLGVFVNYHLRLSFTWFDGINPWCFCQGSRDGMWWEWLWPRNHTMFEYPVYSGFLASCDCMRPNGIFIEYKLYDDSKHLEKHFAYLQSSIELWFKCYSMSRLMIIY